MKSSQILIQDTRSTVWGKFALDCKNRLIQFPHELRSLLPPNLTHRTKPTTSTYRRKLLIPVSIAHRFYVPIDCYGCTVFSTMPISTPLQEQVLFSLVPYGSINTSTEVFSSFHLALKNCMLKTALTQMTTLADRTEHRPQNFDLKYRKTLCATLHFKN